MWKKLFNKFFRSFLDYFVLLFLFFLLFLYFVYPKFLYTVTVLLTYASVNDGVFYTITETGSNIYVALFVAWAVCLLCVLAIKSVFMKGRLSWKVFRKTMIYGVLVLMISVGFLQVLGHVSWFSQNFSRPRYSSLGPMVSNIQYIQRNHHYCESIDLRTDFDLSIDPGMLYHRLFRYIIFPKKLTVSDDNTAADCIVYLNKKGYENVLPDNYVFVERMSKSDAIAVRKDIAP